MPDLDDVIRTALHTHADDAPVLSVDSEGLRARHHRRRARRRAGLAVLAVGAATAAVIAIPLSLRDPTVHHVHDALGSGPSVLRTPPPNEQLIGFHGLEFAVPSSWAINAQRCGSPTRNTVLRDEGATLDCGVLRPAHVSSVELLDNPSAWRSGLTHLHTRTSTHGVRYLQGTRLHYPGSTVIVPSVGVVMFVNTTAPSESRQILASLTTPTIDATGCLMRQPVLSPPDGYQPADNKGLRDQLIPSGPTSLVVCNYSNFWLEGSATTTGSTTDGLVSRINAASPGFDYAPTQNYTQSLCDQSPARAGERGTGYVLIARYANRAPVTLWAHIGECGPLGVTNGVRDGQMSETVASAVAGPLKMSYGLPGRFVSRPNTP